MPFLPISGAEVAPTTTIGDPLTGVGRSRSWLVDRLRRSLGGRGDVTGDLPDWVNDAYQDMATSLELDELKGSIGLTLVAGQPFYELPDSVGTLRMVSYHAAQAPTAGREGYQLSKISLENYRELAVQEGAPQVYFRERQTLVIWPTPTAASLGTLGVDFRIFPRELVEDTDCPIMRREWHRGIVLLAKHLAHVDLLEDQQAIVAENAYSGFVRRRLDRQADEDENRLVGSSLPKRARDVRNHVVRTRGTVWDGLP